MSYREDPDLEFFSKLESTDFNDLVDCLIYDKDRKKRYTEELTKNNNYIRHSPEHIRYWRDIAGELQCYGGNTIARAFRGGKGVHYKVILCEVCDKLKVNYNKKSSVLVIENNMLMKILEDTLEKMSPEELKNLCRECNIAWDKVSGLSPKAAAAIFQTAFKLGGFKSYQLTLIIVNALWKAIFGRGLAFAANASLTRVAAILTGPIGWVLTGIWTAVDIAGPAYRVTIPAVAQVALLRKKFLSPEPEEPDVMDEL